MEPLLGSATGDGVADGEEEGVADDSDIGLRGSISSSGSICGGGRVGVVHVPHGVLQVIKLRPHRARQGDRIQVECQTHIGVCQSCVEQRVPIDPMIPHHVPHALDGRLARTQMHRSREAPKREMGPHGCDAQRKGESHGKEGPHRRPLQDGDCCSDHDRHDAGGHRTNESTAHDVRRRESLGVMHAVEGSPHRIERQSGKKSGAAAARSRHGHGVALSASMFGSCGAIRCVSSRTVCS